MTQANTASLSRILIVLAAAVIVIAGIKAAASIVIPFLCAAFLAVLCLPSLNAMQRRGAPDAIALAAVLGGLVLIAVIVSVMLGSSLNSFGRNLEAYEKTLQEHWNTGYSQLIDWGVLENPNASKTTGSGNKKAVATDGPSHSAWELSPRTLLSFISKTLDQVSGLMSSAFIILLMLSFLLAEAATFGKKLRAISSDPDTSANRIHAVTDGISRYFTIKTGMSFLTGLIIGIFLWILGVDFPFLWAFLALLLNFVPNIGSVMAAVPPVLVALVQPTGGGFSLAISVMIGFAVVNIVIGSVLEPRFLGRGLDLSTLVVFLSLLFWGWVLGPIGMLLSVPLTMTFKIVLQAYPETEGIATMLRASVPEPQAKT